MTVAQRIAAARTRFEAQMIDECTISRGDGLGAFNDVTLQHDAEVDAEIYDGNCLVQTHDRSDGNQRYGDESIVLNSVDVFIPADSPIVNIDDHVTITRSDDPSLEGVTLRVAEIKSRSMTTVRRLICTRNLG